MPDLTAEEMRKRIRALEDQVYPDSMALPEGMPLGSPQDPSEPIHAEFVRLKEQAETPGGEAGLRGLFVDSDGFLQKVQQDGTTERVGGSRSAEEIEDIVGAMAAGVLLYDDANGQLDVPEESIEDIVGAMAAGVLAYDDANGQLDVPEESIEDIVGAMAEAGYGLAYDDENGLIEKTRQGINPYDKAQSFEETGVSFDSVNGNLVRDAGSIILSEDSASITATTNDGGGGGHTTSGPRLRYESEDVTEIFYTVATANTSGVDEVQLRDPSDNSVIMSNPASVGDSGSFTLSSPPTVGDTVDVVLFSSSDNLSIGEESNPEGPKTNSLFTREDGQITDGSSSFRVYVGFSELGMRSRKQSGECSVEWVDLPTDIFSWDSATYTFTAPGTSAVDVFAAFSNDGGSTWTRLNGGNPIGRGFSLAAEQDNVTSFDADSDVRIEAEFSRGDSKPTLDSAYRSWRV